MPRFRWTRTVVVQPTELFRSHHVIGVAAWPRVSLLSRSSRQRDCGFTHRWCPSVCLSVCRQNAKTRFSQKVSNLELCFLLTTYRKLCKLNWAFQRTHYWMHTIQNGWDPPSWTSTWRHFFCRWWSDLDKISQTGTEWHVDCGDMWKWKPDVEF